MHTSSQTVLVVTADETRRAMLIAALPPGWQALAAHDTPQAYALLRAQAMDALVLDLALPGLAVPALLARLHQHEHLPALPVLVLATASEQGAVEVCLAAGARDYLLLPATPTLVRARLHTLLASSRAANIAAAQELQSYERELQIGRQIQAGFLPTVLPQPDGWEIAARFQPAREVAGDFYDAFMLTQNRRLGFVIADVCDKGVGSALFMALFRSLIRAFAQQHHTLSWADVLTGDVAPKGAARRPRNRQAPPLIGAAALKNAVTMTNEYITLNHRQARMFATLFFGVLDPRTGTLLYVNAGHNPPVLLRNGQITALLEPTGPAVGLMPGSEFAIQQVQVEDDAMLFCYTDGVPDARDISGAFWTEERMLELLAAPVPTATALLAQVAAQAQAHIGDAPQFDDMTMLALRRGAS